MIYEKQNIIKINTDTLHKLQPLSKQWNEN
jgi:hypothetical protein